MSVIKAINESITAHYNNTDPDYRTTHGTVPPDMRYYRNVVWVVLAPRLGITVFPILYAYYIDQQY
ncbi:hypothetical protein J6590_004067 [Homalodisca vitripennis]|nr:hypothetical protein J6590_004067 [Homalodisca vitripennis]